MGRQVVITKRRKYGEGTGYMKCNICNGTGRQKVPNRKKSKSNGRTSSR